MKPLEPVLVVGAGIGGLTLAVALERMGIRVRVFERAPGLSEIGAGLALWSSGVRALKALGIGRSLFARAPSIAHGELTNSHGVVLSRFDLQSLAARAGAPCVVLDRRDLHRAIADEVPATVLTMNANVTRVDEAGGGVTIAIEGIGDVRGSVLVGADGLRSVVRDKVIGTHALRYAGETCFRGIAPLAIADLTTLREVQGPGRRSAVCPLDDGRVYWWATLPAKEGKKTPVDERKALLTRAFRGWHSPIEDAIRATPDAQILQHDLYDRLPAKTWSSARTTLLGDAAHPTTPNLGQGAGMAIEDAVVLARALARQDRVEDAFRVYERERLSRASRIVRQSFAVGKIGQWKNPLAVRAKELAFRAAPTGVLEREIAWQVLYDPHAVSVEL